MVKTQFGIKDLENLSNVKAHTIRIWEKRFNLLTPERTDTNIRIYNLDNLKKLLNIAYLYHGGHKISTLANLGPVQIQSLIKESLIEGNTNYVLQVFKSAMFEFNGDLFDHTLNKLLKDRSFKEVFLEVLIPLLEELGVLWHTGTIDPSHEHFISEKIRHTIIAESQKIKLETIEQKERVFALYLPYGEIHDIGLLFANYELLKQGYTTIYLGANLPLESLKYVVNQKPNIIFIAYFTIQPENGDLKTYLQDFENISENLPCQLWMIGRKINQDLKNENNIKLFPQINSFISHLESL